MSGAVAKTGDGEPLDGDKETSSAVGAVITGQTAPAVAATGDGEEPLSDWVSTAATRATTARGIEEQLAVSTNSEAEVTSDTRRVVGTRGMSGAVDVDNTGTINRAELEEAVARQLRAAVRVCADGQELNGTPVATGDASGGTDDGPVSSPLAVLAEELNQRDVEKAKVLTVKVREREAVRVAAEEDARREHKRAKRAERMRVRQQRHGDRHPADVQQTTPENGSRALGVAVGGVTNTSETLRGKSDGRVRVHDDIVGSPQTLQQFRAGRRYEKRVLKAKAKERRELKAALAAAQHPDDTYFRFGEPRRRGDEQAVDLSREQAEDKGFTQPTATVVGKRRTRSWKITKQYVYESGSVYSHSSVKIMGEEERPVRVGRLRAVHAPTVDSLPTAVVKVHEEQKDIKLDTGAQYSVAGEEWQKLGERLDVLPPVDYVEGFTGAVSKVLGVWRFRFRTQYEQLMVVDALMVQGAATEFLLGEDWMRHHGVKIDFTACEMKWYESGDKKVVPFRCTTDSETDDRPARVRLVRRAKVQTRTCRKVELAVAAPEGTVGLFTPSQRVEPHLLLAPTLTVVQGGKVVVPILNLVGRTSRLPSREALGTWAPTEDDMTVIEMTGELEPERVKEWLEGLCTRTEPLSNEADLQLGEMSAEDRELLLKLLRNYPALLEPRTGCPPMTTLNVEHQIHTGNEAPIKVRPRRHAHEEQKIINEHVTSMLNDGVIEPGTGAWGFPVVLVKKKDGSVRFCIDFRLLNAITKKDVYPLPWIDETLDNLHGARRFTSLDLHAGYWQVPVASADRDKTGFVTRQGLFRFVRMPFGLANAPGTFQRMMDATLRGLTWQSCLVYLDDVIVFSKGNMGRHLVELAAVLERLDKAGLSLKASKCSFATEHLEYLGHELDANGVRPMTSLVRSVGEFPVPTDTTELKRFVHMAGYYRRFVPEFASKAAPMTKLLRKGVVWRWAEPQQQAFECLKKALVSRPLLAYPDFTKPFKLVTHASKTGLGAALTQDQGHGEQPVAYASKINSPTVANYSITDLECAAVVWAIKLFRPYLYGRRFELVTDHAALKWLMTSKDLSGRLHRWALQLQEYDFEVVYRPGVSNVVADALSRAPVRAVVGGRDAAQPTAGPDQLTTERIRAEQAEDKTVRRLREKGRYGARAIVVENDVAHIVREDGSRRIVLPTALWASALRESHDSIYACHLRTPQTYARIAANYWWPDMQAHVRRWVQACRDCGSRKTKAKEVIPPLRSQGVGKTGDRWALDVAGPLPLTNRGNRYVIAAVDYATRYAVVGAVPNHTAKDIARFIVENVVLVFGPMREIAMDGAPELNGEVVEALVDALQARQITPVPYRPALIGLVERFHRTWKDMVAIYVSAAQDDWDRWLPCAAYAYNGAKHSGTGFSPNELMMGRRLRAPNELLRTRTSRSTRTGEFAKYYQELVENLEKASSVARVALAKDQSRRAQYYNHRVRETTRFRVGDLVWVMRPPRGKGITKLAHQWIGPAKILQDAGYDNWEVLREDTGERIITHCSFLVSSQCSSDSLGTIADNILAELEQEELEDGDQSGDSDGVTGVAVAAPCNVQQGPVSDRPAAATATDTAAVETTAASTARNSGQQAREQEDVARDAQDGDNQLKMAYAAGVRATG